MENQDPEGLASLIKAKANVNARKTEGSKVSLLQVALQADDDDRHLVIQLLLEGHADPNAQSGAMSALIKAVAAHDTTTVALLLKHGADLNATERTGKMPHHLAARAGYVDILSMLLS